MTDTPRPAPIRVLIADDQRVVREGLSMLVALIDDVEVVGAASDGAEAVRLAETHHPDVILMDLRMPDLDGIAATAQLSEQLPAVRVLVLTTYADEDAIVPALQAGAQGYLTKDASAEQIETAIRAVHAGQTYLDPTVQERLVAAVISRPPALDPASPSRPGGRKPPPAGLTTREAEVLTLLASGLSNAEIARHLYLSHATVKTHVNRIFAKTGARDRAQAVRYAYQHGLTDTEAPEKLPGSLVTRARRVDGGVKAPGTGPGRRRNVAEEVAVPAGPNAYNSLWQVRTDAWSTLEESTAQLALAGAQQRPVEQLTDTVAETLDCLATIERFWAFPGMQAFYRVRRLFATGKYDRCATMVARINRALATDSYLGSHSWDTDVEDDAHDPAARPADHGRPNRPYFEVLVVEDMTEDQERALREELRRWRRPDDQFLYEIVVVPSFDDAVMAARLNFKLQACVVRRRFAHRSRHDCSSLAQFVSLGECEDLMDRTPDERAQILARSLARIRPELDLYLMTEIAVEDLAGRLSHHFRRIFHTREGSLELHLSILDGIAARYRAPFFSALRSYSHRPTGVFHALPVSHGKSIVNSHWIRDMVDFYGLDIFLAETSATCGGLDSLLEPTGPLREAQQLAARTFGSRQTYFVTNGTSTANKIVVQALVQPGDIVLVDRNCHQSHHYGLMLAGAMVTYLDAYRLNQYSMYGAVSINEIKSQLLALRRAGKLDRVKMLLLTNCTFDGIVYDVQRVMQECLAIKPDLIFLWDEAWFAFARFHPVYRPRTGMRAARTLAETLRLPEYRARHNAQIEEIGPVDAADDEVLMSRRLLPDPARARVRVYSTQSTHKTLTSLRQGSMIHVWDQDFSQKVEETFHEAYMTHTSTSPNYQILASLDLGRRQAALEGFELVQKQIENAMRLRDAVDHHPLLSKYMRCLTTADLIPAEHRPSGIDQPLRSGLPNMITAWEADEFVLDPSRITVYIGSTGIEGDSFKRRHLMDRYGVQINKTSRNTVLFMTTIGTTRSSVAYLIEVLVTMARELEAQLADMSPNERAAHERAVLRLTAPSAPLPDFSGFHPSFTDGRGLPTREGDVRRAFYLSYNDSYCEYLTPDDVEQRVEAGEQVVSTTYVTPYPPGFPVLVPGQLFSPQILAFMRSLDTPEVHGYRADLGYRVYLDKALEIAATTTLAPAPDPGGPAAPPVSGAP